MVDLSFILPVYNAENYLGNCINSILAAYEQTVNFNIEINIIDDGSTDGSIMVANEFKKKLKFITIYNQENQGVYVARNKGLAVSKGKYIWFVDADDTITIHSLKLIESRIKTSLTEIIHFPYVQENSKNNFKTYHLNSNFKEGELINGLLFLKYNDGRLYLWTNIYKREFLIQNSLAFLGKIRSLEDSLFNIKAFYIAKKVEFINDSLYEYRMNSSSISRNHSVKKLEVLRQSSNFVHKQLLNFSENIIEDENAYTIISEKLSHSVLGFFYSLLVQKYERDTIVKALKDYKELGLYPVKSNENSVKGKAFQWLLNKPKLYLVTCKLFKAID